MRASGLPRADVDAYADAMLEPGALAAAIGYYRAPRSGWGLSVGRVCVPTLLVWGPGDVALGPVAARSTGRYVDGPYRLEVLGGAGHWIPETRLDQLTALVLDHVRSNVASSAA